MQNHDNSYQGGYPPQQGGYPPQPHQGGYPPQHQGGYPPQQDYQAGYPPQGGMSPYPQQGGYPPQQQGGYPSQQGGYPPQQHGGYPPQQGGYPPQQGGYPQQHGGYSMQQGWGNQMYNQLGSSQIDDLRKMFDQVDVDHDGAITAHELAQMHWAGGLTLTASTCEGLAKVYDTDNSGKIEFNEFAALYEFVRGLETEFKQNAQGGNQIETRDLNGVLGKLGINVMPTAVTTILTKLGIGDKLDLQTFIKVASFMGMIKTMLEGGGMGGLAGALGGSSGGKSGKSGKGGKEGKGKEGKGGKDKKDKKGGKGGGKDKKDKKGGKGGKGGSGGGELGLGKLLELASSFSSDH